METSERQALYNSFYMNLGNEFSSIYASPKVELTPYAAEAIEVLEVEIYDYPQLKEAYIEIEDIAFQHGEYEIALRYGLKMLNRIPGAPEGYYYTIKAFIALERYKDANRIYEIMKASLPNVEFDATELLYCFQIFVRNENFHKMRSADFEDIFFLKLFLEGGVVFTTKLSKCMHSIYFYDYIRIARDYVEANGGRFIYATIDRVVHVRNKSAVEKVLSRTMYKDHFPTRIEWLLSHPPHLAEVHKGIPYFSKKYVRNLCSGPEQIVQATKIVHSDYSSPWVNVANNIRVTTDVPEHPDNKIIIFGGSDAYGEGCEDKFTFSSFLQRKILRTRKDKIYAVENRGLRGCWLPPLLNNMLQVKVNPGDVVVLFGYPKIDPRIEDLKDISTVHCSFSRPHSGGEVFVDRTHVGWTGSRMIANTLYDHIFRKAADVPAEKAQRQQKKDVSGAMTSVDLIKYMLYKTASEVCETGVLKGYIDYVKDYKKDADVIKGSIAVNCNPMTNGHLHLVEYAAKQVDKLYLFVIEEDLSFFPFKDRFEIVKENTKHLDNVVVLKGGKYICTQFTFPDYFSKETVPTAVADASMEAWFFCEYIAKELGISKIFLGNEPICPITSQYNKTMANILPQYGIEVDIIERILMNGSPISASHVRRLLQEQRFDEIEAIVPTGTYDYLVKNYGGGREICGEMVVEESHAGCGLTCAAGEPGPNDPGCSK